MHEALPAHVTALADRIRSVQKQVERLESRVRRKRWESQLLLALQELRTTLEEMRQVEQALRESEGRMRAIVDTVVDGIITIDSTGIIQSFNPAAERIFGYEAAEVIGRNVTILMPSPDRERHDEYLARYLRTGERRIIGIGREVRGRRKDGTVFPLYIAIGETCLGERRTFTGILRDISAAKQAEQRMAAQHAVTRVLATARSLADATPKLLRSICEGLGWDLGELWHVDERARVLRWDGMWHQLDFDPTAFVRQSREMTFRLAEGLPGRVWATGRGEWIRDLPADSGFRRAAAAAQLGVSSAVAFPLLSNGLVVGVMMFFSRELRDPDAGVLEMLETLGRQIGDFLTRRQAEARLQESEARFAEFMAHLPGIAFIKDASGCYLYVNDAYESISHLKPHEILGKSDADIWPARFAAQFSANDRQVIESRRSLQTAEAVPHDDGVHEWLVTKFPIFANDGTVAMVGGIGIDITERRRAEAQLLEMEKLAQQRERLADIGAITAKLAHDLGNPLAAVSMQAQLIVRRVHRDPEQPIRSIQQAAEQILAQVGRLDALTKDLMTFAREQRLNIKPIHLTEFFQELVDFWTPLASERKISIATEIAAGLTQLMADEEKLRRVLDNLIKNAVEAIEAGPGSIDVRVFPEGEKIHITVTDTGPGIPESVEAFKLFETTKAQGTGLGLSIARQIVNAHGGEIDFVRLQPKGTAFCIEIPARGLL